MWKWNPSLKDVKKGEIEEVYKRKELEKECEEASRNIPFDVKDSYEVQGKALKSKLSDK